MKYQNYYIEYTKALDEYISTILKTTQASGQAFIAYYPKENEIHHFKRDTCGVYSGEKVSAGRLIDLIFENQKKKLDFQILGHDVYREGAGFKIGCKTVSFKTVRRIAAEIKKGSKYEIPQVYSEATPEFWTYIEMIKPKDFMETRQKGRFILFSGNQLNGVIFESSFEGFGFKKISPGQFIDMLMSMKPRTIPGLGEDKIELRGDGILTEWGRISYEDFDKLTNE